MLLGAAIWTILMIHDIVQVSTDKWHIVMFVVLTYMKRLIIFSSFGLTPFRTFDFWIGQIEQIVHNACSDLSWMQS